VASRRASSPSSRSDGRASCRSLLLAGTIDASSYVAAAHSVSRASFDGARAGATTLETVPVTGTRIVAAAKDGAKASMTNAGYAASAFTVSAKWTRDGAGVSWVSVTVQATHEPLFGRFAPFGDRVGHTTVLLTQEQVD
jgi:Flp pilus assembly protein TadG